MCGKIDFKIRIQEETGGKTAPGTFSARFRRPDPGVENGIWAEFFVRFGLLEHEAFEIYPSLLVRINFMTECVWARYEL